MAQSSTGPISDGIRRAIEEVVSGGRKVASIAAEAGIAASQIYRFLDNDPEKHRDLSLAALDKIAGMLGLRLAPLQADAAIGAAQAASSAVSAKSAETVPVMTVGPAPDAALTLGSGEKGGLPGKPPANPLPCYQEVRTWQRRPGLPIRQHTIVNIDVFIGLWQGQVEEAVQSSGNLGIQRLWAVHAPGHRCVGHDRVQFWEFISNVALKNPTLLGRPDLADRFRDLTRLVNNPVSLGRIIALLTTTDLDSSLQDAPHALLASIERACKRMGLVDAINPHWNLPPNELQDLAEGKRKRRHIIPGEEDQNSLPSPVDSSRYEDVVDVDNGNDLEDEDDDLEDVDEESEDDDQEEDDLEDEAEDCSATPTTTIARGEKSDGSMFQQASNLEASELERFTAEMEESMELRRKYPDPSHKSVVWRGDYNVVQMDILLQDIENTEIHRLAERYRKPGRKVVERAKFISFFLQALRWNAQGPAILSRRTIYEEYLQVASRLYDHGHMGELANWIEPSDLDLEGEALTERLRQRLEKKGIHDGIHGSFLRRQTAPVASTGFAVDLPKPSNPATSSGSTIRFDFGGCRTQERPKPAP